MSFNKLPLLEIMKILSNHSCPKNLEAYGCHGFCHENSEGLSKDSVFSQIMHAHTHTQTFICCRKSYQGFRLVNFQSHDPGKKKAQARTCSASEVAEGVRANRCNVKQT